MPTLSGVCRLAIVMTALCLGSSAARAQNEAVKYWVPFGPFGYGAAADATSVDAYSSFPGFDAADAGKSGFSFRSYSAPVSSLTSGLAWSGIGGTGMFGSYGSLTRQGTQFDYAFKGVGGLPVTMFGGVENLKYDPDVFSTVMSPGFTGGTTAATSVQAGIEIRPASNFSLSFSAGYTQQQSDLANTDIQSSLLPRELGGRR